jgi:uncharacterized membrane protein YdjX (TVP38/TMEM64 family)
VSEPPAEAREDTFVDADALRRRKRNARLRIAALVVFIVGSLVVAKLTGLEQYLDKDTVRETMEAGGALGFVAFVAIFAVGALLHVPGWVFVGAASVAYGEMLAIPAAYIGSMAAVTLSFFVVRGIGGQPLGEVKRPFMVKMLRRLDTHPIRTVAILRVLLFVSPWLNYALAMSTVKPRDYLIGSALGCVPPVVVMVFFFDWLATWLL